MSHEITVRSDGLVEAMYAKAPAWHRLGTVLDDAPNSELAIKAAHLDWEVSKEPMVLASNGVAVNDWFALIRKDTNTTLHAVGNEYQLLQNIEAFNFLDGLVKDGIIKYEAAFSLKGGKHVCLLARMPSIDTVVEGDNQLRYVFFDSCHGGGSIKITPTSVRVVCANTKRMAIGEGKRQQTLLSIPHSGDLKAKLERAHKFLSQFDKSFTDYKVNAQQLLKGYTLEQKKAYIEALYPAPADDATNRVKTNWQTKVEQIDKALTSEAQRLPGVKGTWWGLFNAVTEAIDHAEKLRQVSDLRARQENRFLDIVSGPGANFKDQAFELALTLAS